LVCWTPLDPIACGVSSVAAPGGGRQLGRPLRGDRGPSSAQGDVRVLATEDLRDGKSQAGRRSCDQGGTAPQSEIHHVT
jgi:hypothetical protein